jgi:hypothetical protein
MHQPRNEPVPDEGVDVPKVRPQGAMCCEPLVGWRHVAVRKRRTGIVKLMKNRSQTSSP